MIGIEVFGRQKLMLRLAKFAQAMEPSVESQTRDVQKKIRDEAKRLVPVDTGSLKKSIRLQTYAKKAKEILRVGVSAGGYVVNPNSGRLVDYASHVERGTSKMRAQPYLGPAFDKYRRDLPKQILKKWFDEV